VAATADGLASALSWSSSRKQPVSQLPCSDLSAAAEHLGALDPEAVMREALAEAEAAAAAGERPIGAVVVVAGEIVSRGRSRQNERRSQLAHAELEALQGSGDAVWERYGEAVLFTTVEPCPLCLGALVMADVPHVVFATGDPLVETYRLIEGSPYIARHVETYCGGVLEDEARALVERYHAETGPN
jgi:tRNA(adenine34) deaminase